MAEKFGNCRWVKEGYLDNGIAGYVVGRIEFAGIGEVEFCLKGDFKPDIAGKVIRFRNSKFIDDPNASYRLGEFPSPHTGQVSLISFDPHPLLSPHPYIEWFSEHEDHFRIELEAEEGWVVEGVEAQGLHEDALKIHRALATTSTQKPKNTDPRNQDWF